MDKLVLISQIAGKQYQRRQPAMGDESAAGWVPREGLIMEAQACICHGEPRVMFKFIPPAGDVLTTNDLAAASAVYRVTADGKFLAEHVEFQATTVFKDQFDPPNAAGELHHTSQAFNHLGVAKGEVATWICER